MEKSVEKTRKKQKIDKTRLLGRILAGLLALMMVVAVASTLVYYIVAE